jgi:hypothetical protein
MLKICKLCLLPKATNEFSPNRGKCKSCRSLLQQSYAANNKEKTNATKKRKYIRNRNFIYDWKLGKTCADCDIVYHPRILHFDHISNDKIGKISGMAISSNIARIQQEMDKCEIVCSNCHRDRTHNRNLSKQTGRKSKTPTRDKLFFIVSSIKKNNPCASCKRFFHSWQMDFDHKDQTTKTDSVTAMIVRQEPIEHILEEIKKCDLVCANCHAERSSIQLNYNICVPILDI